MLDDLQRAFMADLAAREAREQSAPLRPAGTRAPVDDTMSPAGANRLAALVKKFWRDAGYDVELTLWPRGSDVDVRSDLVAGLPQQSNQSGK